MFTYSPANTPIGQSELAYYVRYFIQRGNTIVGKPAVFIVAHKGKNPNWPAANQFAIYKCDRGVKLGTTESKSSKRGSELGAFGLQFQRSHRLFMLRLNKTHLSKNFREIVLAMLIMLYFPVEEHSPFTGDKSQSLKKC